MNSKDEKFKSSPPPQKIVPLSSRSSEGPAKTPVVVVSKKANFYGKKRSTNTAGPFKPINTLNDEIKSDDVFDTDKRAAFDRQELGSDLKKSKSAINFDKNLQELAGKPSSPAPSGSKPGFSDGFKLAFSKDQNFSEKPGKDASKATKSKQHKARLVVDVSSSDSDDHIKRIDPKSPFFKDENFQSRRESSSKTSPISDAVDKLLNPPITPPKSHPNQRVSLADIRNLVEVEEFEVKGYKVCASENFKLYANFEQFGVHLQIGGLEAEFSPFFVERAYAFFDVAQESGYLDLFFKDGKFPKFPSKGSMDNIIEPESVKSIWDLTSTEDRFDRKLLRITIKSRSSKVKILNDHLKYSVFRKQYRTIQMPGPFDEEFIPSKLPRNSYNLRNQPKNPSILDEKGTSVSMFDRPYSLDLSSSNPQLDPKPKILFHYPPNSFDSISITSNELLRLPEGIFLNDTLIDFGLKLIMEDAPLSIKNRTHIFSSFFFRKLSESKVEPSSLTRINVFEKDFLFIPINENLHWYLALIYLPSRSLSPSNESTDNITILEEQKSYVMIFDSLGSKYRKSAIDKIKAFLVDEAKCKYNNELDRKLICGIYPHVPIQPNSTDCGCFLLENVNRLLADYPTIIPRIMSKNNLADWYGADSAAIWRIKLKQAIDVLAVDAKADYSLGKSATTSSDVDDIEILS